MREQCKGSFRLLLVDDNIVVLATVVYSKQALER